MPCRPFARRSRAIEALGSGPRGGLKARLIEATIAACEAERDPALAPILSLLWRFAAEAARTEGRAVARAAARPRLPPRLDFAPANDEGGAAGAAWPAAIKALPAPIARAGALALRPPVQSSPGRRRALDAA